MKHLKLKKLENNPYSKEDLTLGKMRNEVRDLDNGWYEVRGGHGVLWTDKNGLDSLNESMKKSFDELKEVNEDSIILVEFDK